MFSIVSYLSICFRNIFLKNRKLFPRNIPFSMAISYLIIYIYAMFSIPNVRSLPTPPPVGVFVSQLFCQLLKIHQIISIHFVIVHWLASKVDLRIIALQISVCNTMYVRVCDMSSFIRTVCSNNIINIATIFCLVATVFSVFITSLHFVLRCLSSYRILLSLCDIFFNKCAYTVETQQSWLKEKLIVRRNEIPIGWGKLSVVWKCLK